MFNTPVMNAPETKKNYKVMNISNEEIQKIEEESFKDLEEMRKNSEFRVPKVNYTDSEYNKIDLDNYHYPASSILNSFSSMMISTMKDKSLHELKNPKFLNGLDYIATDLYVNGLVDYFINVSFENFCHMIDQLTYAKCTKGFKSAIDILNLKSRLYDMLYNNTANGMENPRNMVRYIVWEYMNSNVSSGNMIINDNQLFQEHESLCFYLGMLLSQAFYQAFCNTIEISVNEEYLNVYSSCNCKEKLYNAANEFCLRNCPPELLPTYVSSIMKGYLMNNIHMLMQFLTNEVYIAAFRNIFTSGYYNFRFIRTSYDENNNKDKNN